MVLRRITVLPLLLLLAVAGCAMDEVGNDSTTTPVANETHGKHGHHGKMDAAAHAAKLQEKLGLTDEQTSRVEQALASGSRDQRMAALKEILTEDQYAELERLEAEHAGHGKHGKHAHHGKMDPAAHAAKLQEKLSLTDEQTAQVEAILRETEHGPALADKIRSVLTADQVSAFDALHAKHHDKDAKHGEGCESCEHGGGCTHAE